MSRQNEQMEKRFRPDGSENPKYIDLLDEDKPLAGQKFACISFISPEDIITKDKKYVFTALKEMIGEADEFRADISSVVSTRIVNYLLNFSKTNSISQQILQRIESLFIDCGSFTEDLKYYIIKEIVNGNKAKFSKLMMNPKISQITIN